MMNIGNLILNIFNKILLKFSVILNVVFLWCKRCISVLFITTKFSVNFKSLFYYLLLLNEVSLSANSDDYFWLSYSFNALILFCKANELYLTFISYKKFFVSMKLKVLSLKDFKELLNFACLDQDYNFNFFRIVSTTYF